MVAAEGSDAGSWVSIVATDAMSEGKLKVKSPLGKRSLKIIAEESARKPMHVVLAPGVRRTGVGRGEV